jgi:hypothetical protein
MSPLLADGVAKSFCGMASNGLMQAAEGFSFKLDDPAPGDPMFTAVD